jgi:hypothetical protein
VYQPWIDWTSRNRNWQTRLDVGKYWNQDVGGRVSVGRRFGRLLVQSGLSRTDHIVMAEGRLDIELDGLSWRPATWLALEPTPRWTQGFATKVTTGQGDWNWLKPGMGKNPPLFARGRDGTWP